MSRLTIDEVIKHCRKTCESIEMVAIAQGKNQEDITSRQYWEHFQVEEWLNELKKYRDAEEQGLLLKLPCKVGDIVYNIVPRVSEESTYREDKVTRIAIYDDSVWMCFQNGLAKNVTQIGESVFLTKEEAEKKLKEMGSDSK